MKKYLLYAFVIALSHHLFADNIYDDVAVYKVAFFSPLSDQNALSVILYKMGLVFCPFSHLAHNPSEVNE